MVPNGCLHADIRAIVICIKYSNLVLVGVRVKENKSEDLTFNANYTPVCYQMNFLVTALL